MFPSESIVALFRWVLYAVNLMYDCLWLTYPIMHTERYIDSRPGDALLLDLLIFGLVIFGIPVVGVLAILGVMTSGHAALAAIGLFLAPPVLTIGYFEIAGFLIRKG